MYVEILTNRLTSLKSLISNINDLLKKEKQAVQTERTEEFEQFEKLCLHLKHDLQLYHDELKSFLERHEESFSYENYRGQFSKKDEELHSLLNEYIELKSKLM